MSQTDWLLPAAKTVGEFAKSWYEIRKFFPAKVSQPAEGRFPHRIECGSHGNGTWFATGIIMTNHELIESWAISSPAVRVNFPADWSALEDEGVDQSWSWKLLGLVTSVGTSAAAWAGIILAVRYFVR